jgi:hypothetical protein
MQLQQQHFNLQQKFSTYSYNSNTITYNRTNTMQLQQQHHNLKTELTPCSYNSNTITSNRNNNMQLQQQHYNLQQNYKKLLQKLPEQQNQKLAHNNNHSNTINSYSSCYKINNTKYNWAKTVTIAITMEKQQQQFDTTLLHLGQCGRDYRIN